MPRDPFFLKQAWAGFLGSLQRSKPWSTFVCVESSGYSGPGTRLKVAVDTQSLAMLWMADKGVTSQIVLEAAEINSSEPSTMMDRRGGRGMPHLRVNDNCTFISVVSDIMPNGLLE